MSMLHKVCGEVARGALAPPFPRGHRGVGAPVHGNSWDAPPKKQLMYFASIFSGFSTHGFCLWFYNYNLEIRVFD
jgi:hypothetical protein